MADEETIRLRMAFIHERETALRLAPLHVPLCSPIIVAGQVYRPVYDGRVDEIVLQPDAEFRRLYERAKLKAAEADQG
jgi:hypothetical protein